MNIQGWFSLGLIDLIYLLSNNLVGNVKQILILKVEYFYFSKDVDVIFIALTCFGVTVYNFFSLNLINGMITTLNIFIKNFDSFH